MIGTADSAFDTGQLVLASSATARNFASSIPGTFAFVKSRIALIVGPPSIDRSTSARESSDSAGCPASARALASAMVKQPACAAAISSSGLVPFSSPKRLLKP